MCTASNAVALDGICLNFLEESPVTVKSDTNTSAPSSAEVTSEAVIAFIKDSSQDDLSDDIALTLFKKISYLKAFEAFETVWPKIDIQVSLPEDMEESGW